MTYEYRCKACLFKFETTQRITDRSFKICPKCKKPALARIITGGIGFKTTDDCNCCSGSSGRCSIIQKEKLPYIDPDELTEVQIKK